MNETTNQPPFKWINKCLRSGQTTREDEGNENVNCRLLATKQEAAVFGRVAFILRCISFNFAAAAPVCLPAHQLLHKAKCELAPPSYNLLLTDVGFGEFRRRLIGLILSFQPLSSLSFLPRPIFSFPSFPSSHFLSFPLLSPPPSSVQVSSASLPSLTLPSLTSLFLNSLYQVLTAIECVQ